MCILNIAETHEQMFFAFWPQFHIILKKLRYCGHSEGGPNTEFVWPSLIVFSFCFTAESCRIRENHWVSNKIISNQDPRFHRISINKIRSHTKTYDEFEIGYRHVKSDNPNETRIYHIKPNENHIIVMKSNGSYKTTST